MEDTPVSANAHEIALEREQLEERESEPVAQGGSLIEVNITFTNEEERAREEREEREQEVRAREEREEREREERAEAEREEEREEERLRRAELEGERLLERARELERLSGFPPPPEPAPLPEPARAPEASEPARARTTVELQPLLPLETSSIYRGFEGTLGPQLENVAVTLMEAYPQLRRIIWPSAVAFVVIDGPVWPVINAVRIHVQSEHYFYFCGFTWIRCPNDGGSIVILNRTYLTLDDYLVRTASMCQAVWDGTQWMASAECIEVWRTGQYMPDGHLLSCYLAYHWAENSVHMQCPHKFKNPYTHRNVLHIIPPFVQSYDHVDFYCIECRMDKSGRPVSCAHWEIGPSASEFLYRVANCGYPPSLDFMDSDIEPPRLPVKRPNSECGICSQSYPFDRKRQKLDEGTMPCGHVYHTTCLVEWYRSNRSQVCPDCRAPFVSRTRAAQRRDSE